MKMHSYNLGEHADAYWLHSAPNPPCVRSRPAGPGFQKALLLIRTQIKPIEFLFQIVATLCSPFYWMKSSWHMFSFEVLI